MRNERLPASFYAQPTLDVARDLIGTRLVHEQTDGPRLVGRIVETEAYTQHDEAFKGWKSRFTEDGVLLPNGRVAPLFGPPGRAYVYLVYHRYWLLNLVTEPEGRAGCVLIRAVEPVSGIDDMYDRRPAARRDRDLTSGPGKLTQAFGIDGGVHGAGITEPPLYIETEPNAPRFEVQTSSRIGLSFGTESPYRFFVPGHPCVSPVKPG